MKTLVTQRLILRSWRLRDLDDFYEYARDPEIGPMAGWAPHRSREYSKQVLEGFVKRNEEWAVKHRESGKVIGSIGLHEDKKRAGSGVKMMGYVLAKQYWGQGLMTEAVRRALEFAFEEEQLELVTISHFTFNNRSRRVIEKCGFRYEGLLRRSYLYYDGSAQDEATYSMDRLEYREAKSMWVNSF